MGKYLFQGMMLPFLIGKSQSQHGQKKASRAPFPSR
jgi:hypothetical protein